MQELVIAAFVGLSLGNSWLCLFLAFGFSTAELRTGAWFLAGRTAGLIVLGLIIILAGMFLEISPKVMQAVAGILAVCFGVILVIQHSKGGHEKRNPNGPSGSKDFAVGCEHPGRHKHNCEKPGNKHGGRRNGSAHGKSSGSKQGTGEVCELSHEIRDIDSSGRNRRAFGFGIGILRGVTPCFKIVVLAPLMVAVSVGDAFLMLLVFVSVSMVYPVIGYLSANTLHNIIRNRKLLLVIGGLILIVVGLYYIYESAATYGVHVPGA